MKQVVTSLGKFLVVAIAATLVLTFIFSALLPGLRSFVSKAFVNETNYVEKGTSDLDPILVCSSERVDVPVNKEAKEAIFENITAQSRSGVDLLSQLSDDYDKDLADRTQVFVYKINADGSNTLMDELDTSRSGEWVVFYLLKDGKGSALLKVPYSVK